MRIGVYIPNKYVTSIKVYTEEILKNLEVLGAKIVRFKDQDAIPTDVDLYWDSRCSGGGAPARKLMFVKKPLVITLHGMGNKVLPANISINPNIKWYNQLRMKWRNKLYWLYFKNKPAKVITVSNYAKKEIVEHLLIDDQKIVPVYHGINKEIFYPPKPEKDRKFLLHISSYQPKKNIDRIIEAYRLISDEHKLPLKIVAPGYRKKVEAPKLEIITEKISHQQAAELYRNARGLVFPSLHESFGMPLAEAMACGCPVITSNTTSCPEIAGNAGILVNPESVQEISKAMQKLMSDEVLFKDLQQKALQRAAKFDWHQSALQHLEIFKSVLKS